MDIEEFCRRLDAGTMNWDTLRKQEEEIELLREEADRKSASLDRSTASSFNIAKFMLVLSGGALAAGCLVAIFR